MLLVKNIYDSDSDSEMHAFAISGLFAKALRERETEYFHVCNLA